MSRAGAHAGRLHPSEQIVFAMVFALMAGFVVLITMSAVKSQVNSLLGGTAAAGSPTVTVGTTSRAGPTPPGRPAIQAASPRLDALLAAALSPVLGARPGRLAVGVIDESTGQQALYGPTQRFSSGSLVTADILAALLARQERAGAPPEGEQAVQATAMMRDGSVAAATALWRDIGQGNGLARANHLLKLTQTVPGAGDQWGQTTTTVVDQLQLLVDVTSSSSPLTLADRNYLLTAMGGQETGRRWGVAAAGQASAAQNASLTDGTLLITNSLGVVEHDGQVLVVVVLSSGRMSQSAGASLASAAAVAAANVMTQAGH